MTARRKLLLVGGGHAHIEVVRRFGEAPVPGCDLIVVDPNPRPIYSGMVPGLVAGQYLRPEVEIDLAALCKRSRVEYVAAAATRIDASRRQVVVGAEARPYDVASLDIGSTVAGGDLPGVREHALPARPMTDLLAGLDALLARARRGAGDRRRFVVVGAGAGGVELAFCLDARLRREGAKDFEVAIASEEAAVLAHATPSLRRRIERAMGRRGIALHGGVRVTALGEGGLVLEGGETTPCDAAIWSTGPAAHALPTTSGLPVDPGGFVRIRPTLQVEGRDDLFAVGDCASLPGMQKAGVYAVRSAPLLDRNLRARVEGRALAAYTPQGDFLSLLNLGDGTAVGAKWGMAVEGRAVMWLKDRIDRAFMEKYE